MKNRLLAISLPILLLTCIARTQDKSTPPLPYPGNVTLTLDEYNRLVALAAKPPKQPDVAPLPYSIKRADIKLKVHKDGLLGTVQLGREVYRKGMRKVPFIHVIPWPDDPREC